MSDGKTRRVATGVPGFDEILHGGLPENRVYLIEGDSGTGKTTMAIQFLLEGARRGERGLHVALSESKSELESVAASHGWSLEPIDIYEFSTPQESLRPIPGTPSFIRRRSSSGRPSRRSSRSSSG
jgi:circadian clock protein KaiC